MEVSVKIYLVYIVFLIGTAIQVITPHYGEKITSKSQQVISSSYKKLIVILMPCNQKSMKCKILGFYNLTHKGFISVSHL